MCYPKFNIAIILVLVKNTKFAPDSRPAESEFAFLLTISPFNKISGDLYAS